jgi:hypothetical protein
MPEEPLFVPIVKRILLDFANNEPAKLSVIYRSLMLDKEYCNKRCRNEHFNKKNVYYWLEQNYDHTRVGKILKNNKTSLNAPRGIIVKHS